MTDGGRESLGLTAALGGCPGRDCQGSLPSSTSTLPPPSHTRTRTHAHTHTCTCAHTHTQQGWEHVSLPWEHVSFPGGTRRNRKDSFLPPNRKQGEEASGPPSRRSWTGQDAPPRAEPEGVCPGVSQGQLARSSPIIRCHLTPLPFQGTRGRGEGSDHPQDTQVSGKTPPPSLVGRL